MSDKFACKSGEMLATLCRKFIVVKKLESMRKNRRGLNKSRLYIYSMFILMFLWGCEKGESFDYEVREHEVVSCKINGEDWVPVRTYLFAIRTYKVQYYEDTGFFSMSCANLREDVALKGGIVMNVDSLKIGENKLVERDHIYYISNDENTSDCTYYYDLDSTNHNYINIENIDTVNYILTGTFGFTAVNDCAESIAVSDGYFDIKYH